MIGTGTVEVALVERNRHHSVFYVFLIRVLARVVGIPSLSQDAMADPDDSDASFTGNTPTHPQRATEFGSPNALTDSDSPISSPSNFRSTTARAVSGGNTQHCQDQIPNQTATQVSPTSPATTSATPLPFL